MWKNTSSFQLWAYRQASKAALLIRFTCKYTYESGRVEVQIFYWKSILEAKLRRKTNLRNSKANQVHFIGKKVSVAAIDNIQLKQEEIYPGLVQERYDLINVRWRNIRNPQRE